MVRRSLIDRMESAEYVKLAEVEDELWYFHALHAHVRRELQSHLPSTRQIRLLDAGCGTGGLLKRLQPHWPNWRWHGIDFMPQACESARRRCPGCDIREGSVLSLPYADESFDGVVSLDVLCQLSYPGESTRALAEFMRVLRPGGLLVLNVPAYRWMWSYHDVAVHSRHRYARKELREQIVQAGFRMARMSHWNALTFPVAVVKRKLFVSPPGSSDVRLQPAIVDRTFRGIMAVEKAWLQAGGRFAWGTSLLASATKP